MGLYYTAEIVFGAEVDRKQLSYEEQEAFESHDKLTLVSNDYLCVLGKPLVYIHEDEANQVNEVPRLSKEEEKEVVELVGKECKYLVVLRCD